MTSTFDYNYPQQIVSFTQADHLGKYEASKQVFQDIEQTTFWTTADPNTRQLVTCHHIMFYDSV